MASEFDEAPEAGDFQSAESAELVKELEQMYEEPAFTPEHERSTEEDEQSVHFKSGRPIAVRRSSGEIEYDWEVGVQEGDRVEVKKYDIGSKQELYKVVLAKDLADTQPVFRHGQPVRVVSSRGENEWHVVSQQPNGDVVVIKGNSVAKAGEAANAMKKVSAAELHRWQAISPKPDEEPTPDSQSGGFLSRFRRRG